MVGETLSSLNNEEARLAAARCLLEASEAALEDTIANYRRLKVDFGRLQANVDGPRAEIGAPTALGTNSQEPAIGEVGILIGRKISSLGITHPRISDVVRFLVRCGPVSKRLRREA